MPARFCFYSTDATDPTDPDTASTIVELNEIPWVGGADLFGESSGRGSVHRTLGGIVVQDFGFKHAGRLISFNGTDALNQATLNDLWNIYKVKDAEYYFTDGYTCFKVRFSRNPAGFKYWRNLQFSERGRPYYTYEINLIVISKVFTTEDPFVDPF